jgi:hypothetical protein
MYVWMCGCICLYIYMYVDVCSRLFLFFIFYIYKTKCVLERIHKVIGHHMYVINIFVCGTHFSAFFCASVGASVYVASCECFMCVFRVNIMFLKKNQYSSNMNFRLKYIVVISLVNWFLCVYIYVCLQHRKMECNSIYNFSMYIVAFHFFVLKVFYPTKIKIVTL